MPGYADPMTPESLAIIGGGNMGRALLRCAISGAALRADRIVVAEPELGKHAGLAAEGAAVVASAVEAIARLESMGGEGQVLLAVKPQMLPALGEQVAGRVGDRVVISIMAGTPGARVRERLGPGVRVVRAMPNLPATIGRGVTALCLSAGAREGDDALARRLFACAGPAVVTVDESMMDAFTAVAGSGPAYLFYLAEAMAGAAESLGFDRGTAMAIVRQTIAGAGLLLAESGATPGELRAAVTSRGGTTAAALAVMDEAGVMAAVQRAIRAARDRGAELAAMA